MTKQEIIGLVQAYLGTFFITGMFMFGGWR